MQNQKEIKPVIVKMLKREEESKVPVPVVGMPFDENAKFKCLACYISFVRQDDSRKHRKSALHKQN